MKKFLLGMLVLGSFSSFAEAISDQRINAGQMKVIEFYNDVTQETSALINYPKHPGSEHAFGVDKPESTISPLERRLIREGEQGICRSLGYERAAYNSIKVSSIRSRGLVHVNKEGYVRGYLDHSKFGNEVTQIVCINKTNMYPNEISVVVKKPTHANANLMFEYNESRYNGKGVCAYLNYEGFVPYSTKPTNVKNDIIVPQHNGDIAYVTINYGIEKVICLKKRFDD